MPYHDTSGLALAWEFVLAGALGAIVDAFIRVLWLFAPAIFMSFLF
jgi:hypothetical protein